MGCCSITSPGYSCSERKGSPAEWRETLSHFIGLFTGLFTQILHDNSYLCTGGRALRVKTVARFAAQQTSLLHSGYSVLRVSADACAVGKCGCTAGFFYLVPVAVR